MLKGQLNLHMKAPRLKQTTKKEEQDSLIVNPLSADVPKQTPSISYRKIPLDNVENNTFQEIEVMEIKMEKVDCSEAACRIENASLPFTE